MKDQHIKLRTTKEIANMVDDLVEHYSAFSIGKVNRTNIIELAISELYKKVKGATNVETK